VGDKWREVALVPLGPVCGNSIVEEGEECDDGAANANIKDACRTTCKKPKCGDDIVDTGEDCDGSADCNTNCKNGEPYHMNGSFYVSDGVFAGDFNKDGGFCTNMVGQTAYIVGNNGTPPNGESGGTWQGNGSSSNSSTNCLLYSSANAGHKGYGTKGGYGACSQNRHVVCSTDASYCNGYGMPFCYLWD
jgi:cysteine-rich repeat protein